MVEEHPVSVWRCRADLPSFERDTIGCGDVEILFGCARALQHLLCLFNAHGIEAHRVQNSAADACSNISSHKGRNRQEADCEVSGTAHKAALYLMIRLPGNDWSSVKAMASFDCACALNAKKN